MKKQLKEQAQQAEEKQDINSAHQYYSEYLSQAPNDISTIFHVEQMLLNQGQAEEAVNLLFSCYQNKQAVPHLKGLIATQLITRYFRQHLRHVLPENHFNFDINQDNFTKHTFRSLASHVDSFVNETKLLKSYHANQLTIRNSPHYIIATPKSASSLFGICIGRIISAHYGRLEQEGPFGGRRGYPAWWELGVGQDHELRPEIGADPLFTQLEGCIYKGHIEALGKNLAVLDMYQHSRYILWFRDPADQIAAMFCHMLQAKIGHKYTCIFPIDEKKLSPKDVEQSIDYLIQDGWLFHFLLYIAKWLLCRDTKKSIVLTYETFMDAPIKALRKASELLELQVSDHVIENIHQSSSTITDKNLNKRADPYYYPHGWSGEVGVWKKYFSDYNYEMYKKTVNHFLEAFPWAHKITEVFPQLGKL